MQRGENKSSKSLPCALPVSWQRITVPPSPLHLTRDEANTLGEAGQVSVVWKERKKKWRYVTTIWCYTREDRSAHSETDCMFCAWKYNKSEVLHIRHFSYSWKQKLGCIYLKTKKKNIYKAKHAEKGGAKSPDRQMRRHTLKIRLLSKKRLH